MEGCLFCSIVKGKADAVKVYEDERVVAFLDINPVNKGHTLLVHKEHTGSVPESSPSLIAEIGERLPKVSQAVKDATGAEGVNIMQNNGRVAGMTVAHVHFHIIPRHEGDGLRLWPQGRYSEGEKEKMGKHIRSFID
jgi:histidine triad (HIT) family protein